jgi:hypothetical protein
MAEVHQFPDGVVFVGLDEVITAIPGDLDDPDESRVRPIELRQIGSNVVDPFDAVDHSGRGQVVVAGEGNYVSFPASARTRSDAFPAINRDPGDRG